MRVMLATIALNEMEWLPKLVEQHRDWPGICGWAFVEGADPCYAETNPEMVSKEKLSIDGTTGLLKSVAAMDSLVTHYPVSSPLAGGSKDQGKCDLRNRYFELAEEWKPDFIVQIDADEFYTRQDQLRINRLCKDILSKEGGYSSIMLKQRHIWYPPVLKWGVLGYVDPNPSDLLSREVVGGYWQVPHTRIWKWVSGMRHVRNHNWPEVDGEYLTRGVMRIDLMKGDFPECIHLGYASSPRSRSAKHSYYVARGEGQEPGRIGKRRRMYLDCRSAWENWKPGVVLPHGAEVIEYKGPVPEVFR